MLGNLNLLLLLHLNLHISDSGGRLAVDHQVRWGRWRMPNLVLTDYLDPSRHPWVVPQTSHEGRLLVFAIAQHLSLLRRVCGSCNLWSVEVVLLNTVRRGAMLGQVGRCLGGHRSLVQMMRVLMVTCVARMAACDAATPVLERCHAPAI